VRLDLRYAQGHNINIKQAFKGQLNFRKGSNAGVLLGTIPGGITKSGKGIGGGVS
jgi:hypothetical protein